MGDGNWGIWWDGMVPKQLPDSDVNPDPKAEIARHGADQHCFVVKAVAGATGLHRGDRNVVFEALNYEGVRLDKFERTLSALDP